MEEQKCLIVHSPRLFYNGQNICSDINYSAIGLFSLAGELEKTGYNTKIINLGIEKYLNKDFVLSDYINNNNIKFIAFSLNWHKQSFDVIETAKIVKEKCPETFISLGGYTAGTFAKEIMQNFRFIDAIIRGEGEVPIVELAKRVFNNVNFSNIPNLIWRKGNEIIQNNNIFVAKDIDLNEFEFFNPERMLHYEEYSRVPYILDYSQKSRLNNHSMSQGICLGRGCLGNCAWCGGGYTATKLISGRCSITYRNAKNIINEIKRMKGKFNIEYFSFSFDPNPADRSYFVDLFNKIENEFNGTINAIYNLDGLPDKKFLDSFKNAFSNESVLILSPVFYNEELRKKYKSFYYSNAQFEEILDYMDELGITSEICFSIMPGVNEFENKKSEKYGRYLKDKYSKVKKYYMYDIEIEPASPWTYNPEKFNIKNSSKTFMDFYIASKGIEKSFENNKFLSEV